MRARLLRTAVTAGVLGLVASAGIAGAAPKPVCNLLEDAKGDTFLLRTQDTAGVFGPQENSLDIVSGDLGSDGKTLTGVLRVEKLATTAATSPVGLSFRLQFSLPGAEDSNLYMTANLVAGAQSFAVGVRDALTNTSTKLADAKGVFDLDKSEVRISAPLSVFKPAADIKKGTKLTFAGWDQTSSRPSGAGPSVFADVARSEKTYVVGDATCVPVGK